MHNLFIKYYHGCDGHLVFHKLTNGGISKGKEGEITFWGFYSVVQCDKEEKNRLSQK